MYRTKTEYRVIKPVVIPTEPKPDPRTGIINHKYEDYTLTFSICPNTQRYIPVPEKPAQNRFQDQSSLGANPNRRLASTAAPGPKNPEDVYGRLVNQEGEQIGTLVERGALYLRRDPSEFTHQKQHQGSKKTHKRRRQGVRAKLRRQGIPEELLHYVTDVKGNPSGRIHGQQVAEGGQNGRQEPENRRPVHDRLTLLPKKQKWGKNR